MHEPETASFGVAAPTTSTTVALTVGDALAIVASREMHSSVASVFARNHPGGAIGAALWKKPREDVRAVMVRLEDITVLPSPDNDNEATPTGVDILRTGYASPSGWVRLPGPTGGAITPSRIRAMAAEDMARPLEGEMHARLVTARGKFIPVAADTSVQRAAEWVRGLRAATAAGGEEDDGGYGDEAVVAVMERGECVGLMEVGRLLEEV